MSTDEHYHFLAALELRKFCKHTNSSLSPLFSIQNGKLFRFIDNDVSWMFLDFHSHYLSPLQWSRTYVLYDAGRPEFGTFATVSNISEFLIVRRIVVLWGTGLWSSCLNNWRLILIVRLNSCVGVKLFIIKVVNNYTARPSKPNRLNVNRTSMTINH